jgi:hypothetical protein
MGLIFITMGFSLGVSYALEYNYSAHFTSLQEIRHASSGSYIIGVSTQGFRYLPRKKS